MKIRIKHTTSILTTHKGQKLPILITLEEAPKILNLPFLYISYQKRQNKSISSLTELARGITYLYDFYYETNPNTLADQRKFIESLLKAFNTRNILNWDTITKDKIKRYSYIVKEYLLWVEKHHTYATKEEQHFTDTIKIAYNFSKQIPKSLLFPNNHKLDIETTHVPKIQMSYPVNKILELLKISTSPQEQLIYMLMAFGGRRPAEIFQMLKIDIKLETQKVIIAHPTKSLIGNKTRTEYLKEFKLVPRTLKTDDDFVGWSRMRFQYPERLESEVVLIGSFKEYFWKLMGTHMKMMEQFKSPYLFLDRNGKPLTLDHLYRVMAKRNKKLKIYGEEGVNPLGLRNFYAYYIAKGLEMDKVIIQRVLGYHQQNSVNKYLVNNDWEKVL